MRVLICGSRAWRDHEAIERWLDAHPDVDTVIHGAAPGADAIAGLLARARGIRVEEYPAQWRQYGPAAGPIRNKQMLEEGKPDKVVWFAKDLLQSKGTRDMVNRARRAEVPVINGRRDV